MKCILISALAFIVVNVAFGTESVGPDGKPLPGAPPVGNPFAVRKRRDIEYVEEHHREKRSAEDPDDKSEADDQVRRKREIEEIEREKREENLLDDSAVDRELEDEEPVKKRKKREIVFVDHDAEMTAEEHERWKREASEQTEG